MAGSQVAPPSPADGATAVGLDRRAMFRRDLRDGTRLSVHVSGPLAIALFLGWAGFDYALEPSRAGEFLRDRLVVAAAMALVYALMRSRPDQDNRPERAMFSMLALVQIGIAWMVPRVEHSLEAYLLGFSLAIYAAAFLVVWHWRWTLALVGVTAAAIAVAMLNAPMMPSARTVTVTAFYLGTAATISVLGQVFRYRILWREFSARVDLELERARNRALLDELNRLSREDPLTGLANRRQWDEEVDRRFADADAEAPLAIVLCDIDSFKSWNDNLGHDHGDEVLKHLGQHISAAVGALGLVARFGGDEFAILLPGATVESAAEVAVATVQRLRDLRIAETLHVTVSVGIASRAHRDEPAASVFRRADEALYVAKRTRNAVVGDGRRWDLIPTNAQPAAYNSPAATGAASTLPGGAKGHAQAGS